MKATFINNSISGVNRRYRSFTLDLPGHSERTVDVPPQYVNDIKKYLKQRHPAVQIVEVKEESDTTIIGDTAEGSTVKSSGTDESTGNELAENGGTGDPINQGAGEDSAAVADKTAAGDESGMKKNKKSGGKK